MKRIHIVGCGPRSGTTLLTEMMIACFDIDVFTEHETRIVAVPPRVGRICLTKAPRDIEIIEPILWVMRNLYVICMIRDPRDMVCSRHGADPDRYWSSLKFWKAYSPWARKLADHPKFISVTYETLVKDPDSVQERIVERIPFLEKTHPFSRFHMYSSISEKSDKALGGLRPVSDSSIGNWKNHLPRVKDQIRKHGSITEDLIDFGYETSAEWERILADVEDVDTSSHWNEYFGQNRSKKLQKQVPITTARSILASTSWAVHVRNVLRG